MNHFLKILPLASLLLVSACGNPYVLEARKAIREFYYGPPKKVIPVNIRYEDERWCYRSIGEVECYQEPQRLPVDSLVAVYPAERFPATREAYEEAIAEREMAKSKLMQEKRVQKKGRQEETKSKKPLLPKTLKKNSESIQQPKNIKKLMSQPSGK